MKKTVLIVEDEPGILETVQIYLIQQGYNVLGASNGVQGLNYLENNLIDIVLLDIMMPEMDGMQMLELLREQYDIPVLVISAMTQQHDRVLGLDKGADDYITKPFELPELLARIKANLRRYEQIQVLKERVELPTNILRVRDIELDDDLKRVLIRGEEIKLTPKEYQILHLLMLHPNRIYSAEEIYETIWQERAINSETIMVHIRNLREKIEISPKQPDYIKVVWGVGYKIEGA